MSPTYMDLDEYFAEVDKWKEAVYEETRFLSRKRRKKRGK